ncbi:unnamed protein product [Aspergillus oryzae]|uniref:Unnamed protein product n=2 Tax=Aspergillus oryzae TaxID=5062 RepID=A0AAN5BU25_ASPOZ|nr:unnamed protein product [Aspergillus oryzae]GMF90256.1 unnamed protein product [Aspergillus oryzae]GMG24885.1 unnamed protein product [Aspergillus oryzae]GMG48027.1 unnamed protein product [Aspergillus oryzae var. brunneus]
MLEGNSQAILGDSAPGSSTLKSALQSPKLEPFCGNFEGWGPLSKFRFDLTPCFLDLGVAIVAAWGLIMGAGAIWFLLKKRIPQPVSKNWHFYAKLVALIFTTALQAAIQVETFADNWLADVRQPNGVVLFYWLFFTIAYGIKLRSLVAQKTYEDNLPYFVCFNISLGLALLEFGLEYLVPKKQSAYDALGDEDECPYEYADIFSVLTFSWMTPMMKFGYKNFLTQDDLWNLRRRDTTRVTGETLAENWEQELQKDKPSLWIALFKSFGSSYTRGAIIKCGSDILAFVQPQLLRVLIDFIGSYETDNPQPIIRGVAIALAMFFVSVSQTMCLHQYFQRAFDTGMRVKSSLTAMIYAKSLRLSSEGRTSKTTGDIVNHMAVDQQRLSDLTQFGTQLWSAPFQITLCMISLYQLVGVSMFAGIGVMILMIPLNGVIARMMKKLQLVQMKNKDSRSRLMTEILNNIKSIKLYAWNTAFMNKLSHIRNDLELNTLRKIGATQSIANFTWQSTPFLVSCSTFTVYALTDPRPLTTSVVFPALTLFNLLTFPLSILPMVITSIIEASVAVKRLTDYFTAEELQTNAVKHEDPVSHVGDESVRIRDASFTWNRYDGTHVVENINFSARKGELSCIVGRVGAGKSSLLQSLLGDLWRTEGEVIIRGRIAYVAQSPWVMNASVRENIVFGHRWDPDFYELTVEACALLDDFKNLPDGDQTEVGERGISLSGGQKARLTLARAVYARADIYLLDDVLSAVDQHVGRHLINKVLGPNGVLSSKTRILATNAIPVLKEADFIGLLRDKTLVEKGTYEQLLAMKGEIANLIRTTMNDSDDDTSSDNGLASPESSDSTTIIDNADSDELSDTDEAEQQIGSLLPIRSGANRRTSTVTLRRASTVSWKGPRRKLGDEENILKSKQTQETSQQGKVKWSVYGEYAKNSNIVAVCFYLAALLGAQTAQVAGSYWLEYWSEAAETQKNPNVGRFIGVYLAFGLGSSVLVIVQNLILWIFCSIEVRLPFDLANPDRDHTNEHCQASRKLHERMAFAIFRSPMSFFETTPSGRILNRFSSVTRSPIYAHFQESLGGISTIRAYKQQNRFTLENEWRMDENLRAYFPSISANRWLAVRLEFIGSIIILASATLSIISVATGSRISPGRVGLAMSYALQITQSLNWIVRQTVEVETNIVSVERVLEYASLPSEAPEVIFKHRPAIGWPAQGAVSFKNYSTRYRPGLDLVLKDINLDIKPHEKIGVVGRTGAGKSSLTLALFRIIEPDGGSIR